MLHFIASKNQSHLSASFQYSAIKTKPVKSSYSDFIEVKAKSVLQQRVEQSSDHDAITFPGHRPEAAPVGEDHAEVQRLDHAAGFRQLHDRHVVGIRAGEALLRDTHNAYTVSKLTVPN